jgi:hypothetical protein
MIESSSSFRLVFAYEIGHRDVLKDLARFFGVDVNLALLLVLLDAVGFDFVRLVSI